MTHADPASLVFNIERADASDLRAQKKHDTRTGGDLRHVREDRTHRNKVLVGSGDPLADAEAVIAKHGAKVRKDNRAPFDRIVLSASRRHFTGSGQDVTQWAKDCLAWARKEYGPGLAYAVAHLDERTPHLHLVCVPLVDRRDKGRGWIVSHSQHPAHQGRNSYAKMRKRAADATGLDYGEPGGKPRTQAEREAQEALTHAKTQATEITHQAHLDARSVIEAANEEAAATRREAAVRLDCAKAAQKRADDHQDRNIALAAALAKRARQMDDADQARAIEKAIADAYPARVAPTKQQQRERQRVRA